MQILDSWLITAPTKEQPTIEPVRNQANQEILVFGWYLASLICTPYSKYPLFVGYDVDPLLKKEVYMFIYHGNT